jgi:periplasmic protein TonB
MRPRTTTSTRFRTKAQGFARRLRQLSTLQVALLVSVGVHAALLGVRIVDPQGFNRVFQDTPLEVILVNARSTEPPLKAQAIAQAALAGGGEGAMDTARQQIEQLQEQQAQLLAQVRREMARLPPPDPRRDEGAPNARQREDAQRQLLNMLAEIEKRINAENARPRKRYISPATAEASYAIYYDRLRRKIEERGTRNFPEENGRKLYGALTMIITIDALGRVLDTEIVQGSGQKSLDKRAQAIVRSAPSFGLFSSEMRAQADQIVVVSRFSFSREDGMSARMLSTEGVQ